MEINGTKQSAFLYLVEINGTNQYMDCLLPVEIAGTDQYIDSFHLVEINGTKQSALFTPGGD